ncbi:MAG: SDR family NAD(P)-dependent oxidoreductase [Candidatus Thorarchaeota archaeon]
MNVLIIGASSGIGREVAQVFSEKSHNIICSSRDEKELVYLTSDLKIKYGNQAHAVPVDLTKISSIENFLKKIYEIYKTIDCVIVTAGTMPDDRMPYYNKEELINTMLTNYTGIALVLNEISRRMAYDKSGVIICLSSVAGERGRQSNFIYGASKSALTTYLQGLRMKLYKNNIHVITVLPGYVDTLMSYGKVKRQLAVSPRYVAKKVYKLTKSNRNVVYIPPPWWLIMRIIKLIPEAIFKRQAL